MAGTSKGARAEPAAAEPVGAYGFRFAGLHEGAAAGLLPLPDASSWPMVEVSWQRRTGPRPPSLLTDDEAVILLVGEEYVEVDRLLRRITFHTMLDLEERELVHPYLAAPTAVMAEWHGRMALHAGGVEINGAAWALVGQKGAGKTTMLTACRARGHGVVTDDLLVIHDGNVFAGPRALDLRPRTAERFPVEENSVDVRNGQRTRLSLRPIPSELPLRGIIVLVEGGSTEIAPVPLADRLTLLRAHGLLGRRSQESVLDVLALPMCRLSFPRRWEALDRAVDLILVAANHRVPASREAG